MNFRTVADMNRSIAKGLWKVPRDVDLIVGIPRSGLLAASLVALHMNLPLADLDGFLAGRKFDVGLTRRRPGQAARVSDCRKALVVDDSILRGRTMRQTREKVAAADPPQQVLYAAVYSVPEAVDMVDLHFEICTAPRMFEWNFMHHMMLSKSCLDIDGILCCDPTPEENDDGPRYEEFLCTSRPLYLPTVPVGTLVTCRLEKYRAQTEAWLRRHGVCYDKLVMMDLPSKEARVASGSHASFKARAYLESDAPLFIESNPKQAAGIASNSGKPVFCLGDHELYRPSGLSRMVPLHHRAKRKLKRMIRGALGRTRGVIRWGDVR